MSIIHICLRNSIVHYISTRIFFFDFHLLEFKIVLMARVKCFSQKAVKTRARVKKHRYFQKLKAIHENKIYEQVYSNENAHIDKVFGDCFAHSSIENLPTVDKSTEIKDKIKYWAVNHRISKTALNDLLAILIFAGFSFLPRDSRTLMGTATNVPIKMLSNGKMWYCGIKKCLEHVFNGIRRNISIFLDFNFDGLPIAKSSNKQFWPILSSIRGKYL